MTGLVPMTAPDLKFEQEANNTRQRILAPVIVAMAALEKMH